MNHNELCQKVLDLDPQVRFSGILNSKGDLIVECNRKESVNLLATDELKMIVHYTFQSWSSIQNLAHKIGKETVNISEFEKVTLICFLLNDGNLLLLSLEPGTNYMEIISKVKKVVPEE